MDAQLQLVAEKCLNAAYDGSMAFPQIIATLVGSGFEGYIVDYRRHTTTYYLPDGDGVTLDAPHSAGNVAAGFDSAGVETAVREAQANLPGYSYAGFCEKVKAHGCAGYIVSFPGRRVVYFGRTGETHVELFPQQ